MSLTIKLFCKDRFVKSRAAGYNQDHLTWQRQTKSKWPPGFWWDKVYTAWHWCPLVDTVTHSLTQSHTRWHSHTLVDTFSHSLTQFITRQFIDRVAYSLTQAHSLTQFQIIKTVVKQPPTLRQSCLQLPFSPISVTCKFQIFTPHIFECQFCHSDKPLSSYFTRFYSSTHPSLTLSLNWRSGGCVRLQVTWVTFDLVVVSLNPLTKKSDVG